MAHAKLGQRVGFENAADSDGVDNATIGGRYGPLVLTRKAKDSYIGDRPAVISSLRIREGARPTRGVGTGTYRARGCAT